MAEQTGVLDPHADTMEINMGPQHPSTHGVLRVKLEIDGEIVRRAECDIGYLHTGFEKTFEEKTYTQGITLTDRMDYLAPPINNVGYCLAVEKLLDLEAPPRAQAIRVLMSELARIGSHLIWLGTHALDLGATTVFLYCWREREMIMDLNEELAGVRMMTSFTRVGGVGYDLPPGWLDHLKHFLKIFPSRVDEYERLLTKNPIWKQRTVGLGKVSAQDAIAWGMTGPSLRGSGVNFDVRKQFPYSGYEQYAFDVPLGRNGDVYDRYLIRVQEMRESHRILEQAVRLLPAGPVVTSNRKVALPPRTELSQSMESLIHHFRLVTEGFKPPAGEVYAIVESPRGELGFYLVSDGSNKPYRLKVRAPSFCNLSALSKLVEGALIADVVAIIGSIDIVLGDVDR